MPPWKYPNFSTFRSLYPKLKEVLQTMHPTFIDSFIVSWKVPIPDFNYPCKFPCTIYYTLCKTKILANPDANPVLSTSYAPKWYCNTMNTNIPSLSVAVLASLFAPKDALSPYPTCLPSVFPTHFSLHCPHNQNAWDSLLQYFCYRVEWSQNQFNVVWNAF